MTPPEPVDKFSVFIITMMVMLGSVVTILFVSSLVLGIVIIKALIG